MSVFKDIANKLIASMGKDKGTPLDPIQDQNEQSPDEVKLINYVRNKVDQVRQTNSRITLEGVYLTNVAYLLGFDGVYYDNQFKQFKSIDPRKKITRSRFRINKILPTVQNRLARLTQAPPKYDVRPNSNSSEDKDAARLGLEVLNDVFDKQNFTEKRQDLCLSAMQGGVAYAQVLWDPALGQPMIDPETQEFLGYEGDVRIEILNCLEVFPDPLAKSLDDAQWVIKAKVRKLDYFKERYPERGDAVKEEGVWLLSSLYDLKANALTSVGIAGANTSEQMKNSAIELVYYERRSKEYPNGRMVVVSNGILLEDKELPIGEFDIVKFDDLLIGSRYNSEGVITHLRPVQDHYNTLRSRMSQWVKMHLGGKYLVPKGSGLSQEAINNSDAEVLEFNPVANAPSPQPLAVPTIPQYAYEEIKATESDFDFISGINEPTRGVAPGSDMPARAMELLVEQDQTRIGVQTSRNEVGFARLGCSILKYVGKYYEMPRLLKVAGDGLGYTVKEFKGAFLNGNYDAIVIAGSTTPNSKVLNRQAIMNLLQMGILGNPQDPKLQAKLLKVMEYADLQEIWKEQAIDEQQIKKTFEAIESGQMPQMHEWDNHPLFVQEMNIYRKTDKFDELSDQQKGLFNYVAEWHLQAEANLQNPGLPQQQMMAQHMVNTMESMQAQGHPAMNSVAPPPPTPQQPGEMPIGA